MLHHTQLSFIQLGGGIAVGGHEPRAHPPKNVVLDDASIGVCTSISQVHSQLYNDISSQIWNVGGGACDLIIAVCMTYYVGFPHFSQLSWG
jgi:hypothetical protein